LRTSSNLTSIASAADRCLKAGRDNSLGSQG
jgi:hypothetical protein